MSEKDIYELLVEQYPKFFSELRYGFECGLGWYHIIERLTRDLVDISEADELDTKVVQIKEKYGTLRFYLSAETEDMSALIDEAEKKSARTCELCGQEGEMEVRNHWLSVRCQKCRWENKN